MTVSTPPARGLVAAAGRERRGATLALARAEARRLLRHPVVLVALGLLLALWLLPVFTGTPERFPVLHYADAGTAFELYLLAGAAMVAANLAVLRSHRHGVDATVDLLPLAEWRRTLAHLLSLLPLAVVATALAALRLGQLWMAPGAVGRPNPFEVAVVPLLVLLLGGVGVLLGRLVRSAVVVPLLLVLAVAWWSMVGVRVGAYQPSWLDPVVLDDAGPGSQLPADLRSRPIVAHLVYLAGLVVVVAATAVLRSGGPRVPVAGVAVVAVAATAAGAVLQDRPPSPELTARRTAAAEAPAAQQRCERRATVDYCVFDGFGPYVDDWAAIVDGVRRRVPAARAQQPFAVRQRITMLPPRGADAGLRAAEVGGHLGTWQADDRRAGTPVTVSVPTGWGQDALATGLAAQVAYLAVAGTVPAGDGTLACGGVGVVTLWLAAQATPATARGLHETLSWGNSRTQSFGVVFDGPRLNIGDREVEVAAALLRRPADQVAGIVAGSWAELTSPKTTVERAAAILGAPVPAPLAPIPADERASLGECP